MYVTIRWHNLLRMQVHIQIVDGKWDRVFPSNETMILKIIWSDFPHTKTSCQRNEVLHLTIIIYLNLVCHLLCSSLIVLYYYRCFI